MEYQLPESHPLYGAPRWVIILANIIFAILFCLKIIVILAIVGICIWSFFKFGALFFLVAFVMYCGLHPKTPVPTRKTLENSSILCFDS